MLDQEVVEKIRLALGRGKSELEIIDALKTMGFSDSDIIQIIIEAKRQRNIVSSSMFTPSEPVHIAFEEEKNLISDRTLIIVITILLLIDGAAYVGSQLFANQTVRCSENDMLCITASLAKNCTPTTAILKDINAEMRFEVIGPNNGYCTVKGTFTKINGTLSLNYSGAIVGDYIICRAPIGDTDIGITDPHSLCKGPIYEMSCQNIECAAGRDIS
jgi:hypothetical protein